MSSERARGSPGGSGWLAERGRPTVTLLLRHGQTPLSAERRFAGVTDLPLTPLGAAQAQAAAGRLAAASAGGDGAVGAIVTSPLTRARETAAAVAAATGAPVAVAEKFRETDFGEWEGLTFAQARDVTPDAVTAWLADPAVPPPGGESFAQVAERVRDGLDELLNRYAGQTAVLVSHVTPIKILVAHALGAPLSALYRMHLDLACLSRIDWYPDGPAVVRSLNDTAHL
jgi:ribonuclease H / adenosylcobalamin/alpha-ribazole phosphatase